MLNKNVIFGYIPSHTGAVCCKNTIVCLVDDNPRLVQFCLFTLSLARQNLGLQHYEVLNLEIMKLYVLDMTTQNKVVRIKRLVRF